MNKIKLVIIDLDDTILIDNTKVSQASINTIEKLLDNNIEVVIATGRYYDAIPEYFINNKRINYLVSSNGALITDNQSNERIFNKNLSYKIVLNIIQLTKAKARHIFVATSDGVYIDENLNNDEKIKDNEFFTLLKSHATVVDDMYDYIKENKLSVKKIEIAFDDLDFRDNLYADLQKMTGLTIAASHHTNVEATNSEVNKGAALSYLMKKLNLSRKETIAIGDNDNDLSMIKVAGIGVAMNNSTPLLKENSDVVTASIYEDGFTKAIDKIVKMWKIHK